MSITASAQLDLFRIALLDYLNDDREAWREAVAALQIASFEARPASRYMPPHWPEVPLSLGPALSAARSLLHWQRNPNYAQAAFVHNYCYCELMGPEGHARNPHFALGLLYLNEHTHYPAHAHPAEEIYHVLTANSQWRSGSKAWQVHTAGDRIFHPARVPHEMKTHDQPLLALYLWRGDILTKAEPLV
ncbi:MAG: dimethylsulfonioproprionate lyase family protein [Proteobacteria bacterium]|nr:dimethylsulfonioproprionate lyase family protein [Pseudomonadota bacterium]